MKTRQQRAHIFRFLLEQEDSTQQAFSAPKEPIQASSAQAITNNSSTQQAHDIKQADIARISDMPSDAPQAILANITEWLHFIRKNHALLQGFILHFPSIITPFASDLHALCKELELAYIIGEIPKASLESRTKALDSASYAPSNIPFTSSALPISTSSHLASSPLSSSPIALPPLDSCTLIHKVRSGEELHINEHAVILGDIAHGAHIFARGSLIIMGDCAGVVLVEGAFIVMKNLLSGYISLQHSIIKEPIIAKINANKQLKIIIKNNDTIAVKEIL